MSPYLSTGGFKGLREKAIDKVNLAEYRDEVDLEYPQKLHNGQNLYFLRYASKLLWKNRKKYNVSIGLVKKLVSNIVVWNKMLWHISSEKFPVASLISCFSEIVTQW